MTELAASQTWWWKLTACALILAVVGTVGVVVHQPWLFPSLGPTVVLMLESPRDPSASVVNALVGHLAAVVVGLGCLLALGLYGRPSVPVAGLSLPYVVSGVLSVTLTMAVLAAAHRPHPPAGATTLLVSLGILTTPAALLSVTGAVLVVVALSWVASRRVRQEDPPDRATP